MHREPTFTPPPLFIFEHTRDDAIHNATVLENYNFNINEAIRAKTEVKFAMALSSNILLYSKNF